jgi:hypothetical protein
VSAARHRRARMRQDEGAGAVGRLGLAGRKAGLADGGGLLVARHAGDRNGAPEMLGQRFAQHTRAVNDLRQRTSRHAEQGEQGLVPAAPAYVHQRGARGIGRVGHVEAAGQLEDEPAFHRADAQILARLAQRRPVLQRPGDLGRAEIGIEEEPGLLLQPRLLARFAEPRATVGRAPVLPDDGRREGAARPPAPEADRLALVGDPDRRDPCRAAGLLHHRAGAGKARFPDFLRIVLDPAGARIMLREFLLRSREAGASLRGAKRRSNPVGGGDPHRRRWIASLRSQ